MTGLCYTFRAVLSSQSQLLKLYCFLLGVFFLFNNDASLSRKTAIPCPLFMLVCYKWEKIYLFLSIIAIYAPMIYTAPCVMLLMRAASITRALEIETFLDPVKWHRADRRMPFCHFPRQWELKSLFDTGLNRNCTLSWFLWCCLGWTADEGRLPFLIIFNLIFNFFH